MAQNGPVIIVEDDPNDAEVIAAAIKDLGIQNPVKIFFDTGEVTEYLLATSDKPFIILCDIRMSAMNGLAFRKKIIENDYLKQKSIPFIFFTGIVSQEIVDEAYAMDVQGFFRKAVGYEAIKAQLSAIYIYWRGCLHPNSNLNGL